MAFSQSGTVVAVLCNDRTVRLFDAESARQTAQVDLSTPFGVATFALSPSGKTVYVTVCLAPDPEGTP